MAETVVKVRLRNWYLTEAEWEKLDPVLLLGENGYVTDKPGIYKAGDGTKKWSELTYNKFIKNVEKTDSGITITYGDGTTGTIEISGGGGANVVVSADTPSTACIWKQIV
nr:MAG TPA: hyaluronidase [Caudoviricetes sp.]